MSGFPLDAESTLIGSLVGTYRVEDKIGEGGMGCVYLAVHPVIGKRVAIKVLHGYLAADREIVSRFFTEARAVTRIGHRNIVDVLDSGVTEAGICYITMELLEGESLAVLIEREHRVPLLRAVSIGLQVAEALDASHNAGIVHRDLKPENVHLARTGDATDFVKVLDFGIAKLMGDRDRSNVAHRTRSGVVIGTPAYMSPEQCAGQADIDPRTDIYALGTILFHLLAGRCPFEEDNIGRMLLMQMTQRVPKLREFRPELPESVEAVIDKALQKNRDARFATVAEFARALRASVGIAEDVPAGVPGASSTTGSGEIQPWKTGRFGADIAPERLVGLPTPRKRTPVPPPPRTAEPDAGESPPVADLPHPPAPEDGQPLAAGALSLAPDPFGGDAGPPSDLHAPLGDELQTFRVSPDQLPPEIQALRREVREQQAAAAEEAAEAEAAAAAESAVEAEAASLAAAAVDLDGETEDSLPRSVHDPLTDERASDDLPDSMPGAKTAVVAMDDVEGTPSSLPTDPPTLPFGGSVEEFFTAERTAVVANPMAEEGSDDPSSDQEGGLPLPEVPTKMIQAPPEGARPERKRDTKPDAPLPPLGPFDDGAWTAPDPAAPVNAAPTQLLHAALRNDAPTQRLEVADVRDLRATSPSGARHDETGRVLLPSRTAPILPGRRRSGRAAVLWIVSILGGIGIGVGAYVILVHRGASAHDRDDDPPAAGDVRIGLDSTPRGAKVLLGEDVIGTTPTSVDLPKNGKVVEFVFAKTGYESRTRRIRVNESRTVHAALVELTEADDDESTGAGTDPKAAERAPATGSAAPEGTTASAAAHPKSAAPAPAAKRPAAKKAPKPKKGSR